MTIKEQLASMEAKLDHMHKDLTKNHQDIEILKAKMNLFGGIVIAITVFITKLLGIR